MQITIHTKAVHLHDNGQPNILATLFGGPLAMKEFKPTEPKLPTLAEGETYCCLMPARGDLRAYHLIFGPESAEQLTYGPEDAIDNAIDHYDGAANTAALLASGKPHPAAAYCRDLGDQWYLPAHAELMAAYVHSPDSFKKDGWYLSSTQHGRYTAWCQAFEYGGSGSSSKCNLRRVRPARRSFI